MLHTFLLILFGLVGYALFMQKYYENREFNQMKRLITKKGYTFRLMSYGVTRIEKPMSQINHSYSGKWMYHKLVSCPECVKADTKNTEYWEGLGYDFD